MYLEASDHACPHLRETHRAKVEAAAAIEHGRSASGPLNGDRASSEHLGLVAATASVGGGWWAFKAEALAMAAQL